ncbi:MAG: hypothetical protein K1W02_05815, partial [Muribaculaceae bacterium]
PLTPPNPRPLSALSPQNGDSRRCPQNPLAANPVKSPRSSSANCFQNSAASGNVTDSHPSNTRATKYSCTASFTRIRQASLPAPALSINRNSPGNGSELLSTSLAVGDSVTPLITSPTSENANDNSRLTRSMFPASQMSNV